MSVPQRLPPQRRSQSDRYRLVAEFTNDIIAELDPDGHILWVSDSIQRVLGIEADLASAPLRDCLSNFNGYGHGEPGSLAYNGGREAARRRAWAQETLEPYLFSSASPASA